MLSDGNHCPPTHALLSSESHNGKSLISPEKLRELYASMVKCRILSETLDRLSADKKGSGRKEEASKVACCIDLRTHDAVSCAPRDYPAQLLADVSLGELIHNVRRDHRVGRSRSVPNVGFPSCSSKIIPWTNHAALQISLAVGVAAQFRRERKDSVALVFCGDNPRSLDDSEDALVFAGRHRLPVLFVVQEHAARTSFRSNGRSMRSVDPYGFPSIPVDGSDAIAVYRVAFEAAYKARIGVGPTLITCKYDRHSPDPLVHAENYLKKKGLWSDEFATRVAKSFSQELKEARRPGLALRH